MGIAIFVMGNQACLSRPRSRLSMYGIAKHAIVAEASRDLWYDAADPIAVRACNVHSAPVNARV